MNQLVPGFAGYVMRPVESKIIPAAENTKLLTNIRTNLNVDYESERLNKAVMMIKFKSGSLQLHPSS